MRLALHGIHVIPAKVETTRDRVRMQVWIGYVLVTALGSKVRVERLTTTYAEQGVVAVNLMTISFVVRLD